MVLHFTAGQVRSTRLPILTWSNDDVHLVRLHADPARWVTVNCHWSNVSKRSVPCPGKDCPFCPGRTNPRTYCPGVVLDLAANAWKRRIIPLSAKHDFARDFDLATATFRTQRRGRFNSPVTWTVASSSPSPLVLAFEILETLEALFFEQKAEAASLFSEKFSKGERT
jgi:hypothetical protein